MGDLLAMHISAPRIRTLQCKGQPPTLEQVIKKNLTWLMTVIWGAGAAPKAVFVLLPTVRAPPLKNRPPCSHSFAVRAMFCTPCFVFCP